MDPGYVLQEPGSKVMAFCGWRQQGRKKEGRLWELVTCRGNGENPIRCKSLRMEWKVSDIPRGRKLLKNRWGKENQFHFEHTAFNLPMGHDKYTWLEVSWNCRSEVKSERRVGWKSLKCNQANKMGNLDSPAHAFFFFQYCFMVANFINIFWSLQRRKHKLPPTFVLQICGTALQFLKRLFIFNIIAGNQKEEIGRNKRNCWRRS